MLIVSATKIHLLYSLERSLITYFIHKTSICHQDGNTPLHHATVAVKTESIALLAELGADMEARNEVRCTFVMYHNGLSVSSRIY